MNSGPDDTNRSAATVTLSWAKAALLASVADARTAPSNRKRRDDLKLMACSLYLTVEPGFGSGARDGSRPRQWQHGSRRRRRDSLAIRRPAHNGFMCCPDAAETRQKPITEYTRIQPFS